MGGLSSERDVSLRSGRGVLAALRGRGYDAVAIDWNRGSSLPYLLDAAGVDVVWNALHGTLGEDGHVQGLLACMGIPGTGSGVLASALAMDKVAAKRIFDQAGVPTPRWHLAADATERVETFPCVVKPSCEGSSVGVTIVRDPVGLPDAVARAAACHGVPFVEAFVDGAEVCVGILDGEVLGDVEVVPADGFYDYAAKYARGDTTYRVPAPLAARVRERVHAAARAAWTAIGGRAHGRVDLRVTPDGEPLVLEVNTLPGMTETSLLPKIAAAAGLDYATLCERILLSAA